MANLRRTMPPADGITVRRKSRALFQQHRPNCDICCETSVRRSIGGLQTVPDRQSTYQGNQHSEPLQNCPEPNSPRPIVLPAVEITRCCPYIQITPECPAPARTWAPQSIGNSGLCAFCT